MNNIIKSIDKASPLRRKAKPGDALVSINGEAILDVLDYKYFSYDSKLVICLRSPDGRARIVAAEKPEGADLGLEFESYLMDSARSCSNRCLFCFVDQLPRGMRKSLYFKDDDARLSFLTGNYITLTNLSEREIERIIALKVSPINVSVHATDPQLRAKLLGNPDGARGYALMQRLADGGITMNCQIVCCPGINDGEALSKSMEELSLLYPQVNSVSIVPVGLTKHRAHLPELIPFDRQGARETISRVSRFADECMRKHASRIFFCSDELYLRAELPLPDDEYYEGYPQLENGVGMLRLLESEFIAALSPAQERDFDNITPFSIATGVSAAPFLQKLLVTLEQKCDKIQGGVYPIVNDFLGHTIDVAGLVTGGDLIAQLRGKDLGERLLIPVNMIRHGEDVFLDDVTISDIEVELGVPVRIVPQDGGQLLDAILNTTCPSR